MVKSITAQQLRNHWINMHRGPKHSGPFGLACTNCFKAKCRCVARADGEGCQRCHRLRKHCEPSEATRQRTAPKKPTSHNRISEVPAGVGALQRLATLLLDGNRSAAGAQAGSCDMSCHVKTVSCCLAAASSDPPGIRLSSPPATATLPGGAPSLTFPPHAGRDALGCHDPSWSLCRVTC